jgi:uncharacterized membrane protein YgcG
MFWLIFKWVFPILLILILYIIFFVILDKYDNIFEAFSDWLVSSGCLSLLITIMIIIPIGLYKAFQSSEVEDSYNTNTEGYSSDNEDNSTNTQHVDPHWVEGYERSDGTKVDGYWRGGSDGYERSDPGGSYDSGGSSGGDWDVLGW